jgi:hypothetical protein
LDLNAILVATLSCRTRTQIFLSKQNNGLTAYALSVDIEEKVKVRRLDPARPFGASFVRQAN